MSTHRGVQRFFAGSAGTVLLFAAAAHAFAADSEWLKTLSGLLVGNQNTSTSNTQNDPYYDNSGYLAQGGTVSEEAYQNLARLQNSLENDEQQIREFERRIWEGRRNGTDTSADEQLLANQKQAYLNDRNEYYAARNQIEQARSMGSSNRRYIQTMPVNSGQTQQAQALAQEAYQNLGRLENSVRSDKQQIRELEYKIQQGRQSGADTSADEQQLAIQQQALQNDLRDYQSANAQWMQRNDQMRQGYGQPSGYDSMEYGRVRHRRSGWDNTSDDFEDGGHWRRRHQEYQ